MGILNVTGMEMFEFMPAGAWLVLFARNVVLAVERVAVMGPEPVAKNSAGNQMQAMLKQSSSNK